MYTQTLNYVPLACRAQSGGFHRLYRRGSCGAWAGSGTGPTIRYEYVIYLAANNLWKSLRVTDPAGCEPFCRIFIQKYRISLDPTLALKFCFHECKVYFF